MTTSARYWRINITAYASYPSVSELEFADYGGAPHTGGTAIESSHFGSLVAANAFDGTPTTCWAPSSTSPAWVGKDFGSAVTVNSVRVMGRYSVYDGSGVNQYPTSFQVQSSSDGSTWNTEWTVTNTPTLFHCHPYPRPGGGTVLWRVKVSAVDTGSSTWGQSEVQLRSTIGGADDTGSGRAFGGGDAVAHPASNGVDDDTSTYFDSGTLIPASGPWWAYEFPSPITIAQVALTARTGSGANWSAADFVLASSDDGITFTAVQTITGETGWSLGETRYWPSNPASSGPTFRVMGFVG